MSKLDLLLSIGVPYMNESWSIYPHEQEHMIKGFQNTQGFKDAKQQTKALMLDLMNSAEYKNEDGIEYINSEDLRKKVNEL